MQKIYLILCLAAIGLLAQAQTIDLLSTAENDSATIALQQDANKMGGRTYMTVTQWGKPAEHMPLPLLYYGIRAGVKQGELYKGEGVNGLEVGSTFWQLTHYQSGKKWFFHCGWNAGISTDLIYQHITSQLEWKQTGENAYAGCEYELPKDKQFYAFGSETIFRTGFPICWSHYTNRNGTWTLGLEPELMLHVRDDRAIKRGYDPHSHDDYVQEIIVAPNLALNAVIQYQRGKWGVGLKFDVIDILSIMQAKAGITGRLLLSYKF